MESWFENPNPLNSSCLPLNGSLYPSRSPINLTIGVSPSMTANSTNSSGNNSDDWSLYPYDPSKVLPIVFGVLVAISGTLHLYQGFIRYKYKRFGGFIVWGSSVWVAGFILREISAYMVQQVGIFIAQFVLILAGPPIYAAAEYFILGRLLYYVPYHAPLHPGRCMSTFLLLGIAVEILSSNGASRLANSTLDSTTRKIGGHLIEASLILQACVELLFLSIVIRVYLRCRRSGVMPRHVRMICYLLCTTSSLILIRCIFRAVEAFQSFSCKTYYCGAIAYNEWYLWVFEVAVIVIYIYTLNIVHPGRFLPANTHQYLDPDGVTERIGPGWEDPRNFFMTVIDPFGIALVRQKGRPMFWESSNPLAENQFVGARAKATTKDLGSDSEARV